MGTVNIFVTGVKEPVFRISMLELAARSRLFYDLFSSLDICEGCGGEMAVIITDEERLTVEAVFSQVAHFNKRKGVSIIQDQHAYAALTERLEFVKCFYPLPKFLKQRPATPVQFCVNEKKEKHVKDERVSSSNIREADLDGKKDEPETETEETPLPTSTQNPETEPEPEPSAETVADAEMERATESPSPPEDGNELNVNSDQEIFQDFSVLKLISEGLRQKVPSDTACSDSETCSTEERDSNEMRDGKPDEEKSEKSTKIIRLKKVKTKGVETDNNDEDIEHHLDTDEKSLKKFPSIDEGLVTDPYDFDINKENQISSCSSLVTPAKRKRKGSREEWKLNDDSQESSTPKKKRKRKNKVKPSPLKKLRVRMQKTIGASYCILTNKDSSMTDDKEEEINKNDQSQNKNDVTTENDGGDEKILHLEDEGTITKERVEDINMCGICGEDENSNYEEETLEWVQCSGGCDQWFHQFCVLLEDEKLEEEFFCYSCSDYVETAADSPHSQGQNALPEILCPEKDKQMKEVDVHPTPPLNKDASPSHAEVLTDKKSDEVIVGELTNCQKENEPAGIRKEDNKYLGWVKCASCEQWFHLSKEEFRKIKSEVFKCNSCLEATIPPQPSSENKAENPNGTVHDLPVGRKTTTTDLRKVRKIRKYMGEVAMPENTMLVYPLQCRLCERTVVFQTRRHLYSHYSNIHIKESLLPFIDTDTNSCTICGQGSSSKQGMVYHIGVAHGRVEAFIPSDYHVPIHVPNTTQVDDEQRIQRISNQESVVEESARNHSAVEEPLIEKDDHLDNSLTIMSVETVHTEETNSLTDTEGETISLPTEGNTTDVEKPGPMVIMKFDEDIKEENIDYRSFLDSEDSEEDD